LEGGCPQFAAKIRRDRLLGKGGNASLYPSNKGKTRRNAVRKKQFRAMAKPRERVKRKLVSIRGELSNHGNGGKQGKVFVHKGKTSI